nr:hypothetical protein CPGR_00949 [Mycolicibacter nonchromogenicus]
MTAATASANIVRSSAADGNAIVKSRESCGLANSFQESGWVTR